MATLSTIAARYLVAALILLPVSGAQATSTDRSKDISAVMQPLSPEQIPKCGLSLRYPGLKNFFDQTIEPGCTGSYKDHYTILTMR